jgi:hypothetical protein
MQASLIGSVVAVGMATLCSLPLRTARGASEVIREDAT